jgi:glycosyltransferase involved in cell wall biosynthesis
MSDQYLFSIVIPALNEEHYIPNLLNSLSNQTFNNFEITVVDAGSRDATVDCVSKLREKFALIKIPLTTIISPKQSVAFQRNIGAQKSTGKYIVFLDADTKVPINFLEQVANTIKNYPKNSLFTTSVHVDKTSLAGIVVLFYLNLVPRLSHMMGKPFSPGFTTIMERSSFLSIGMFDQSISILEDFDLSMRARRFGYQLHVIKSTYVIFSLRRFRTFGALKTFLNYARIIFSSVIKEPPRDNRFHYPMGGRMNETHENHR